MVLKALGLCHHCEYGGNHGFRFRWRRREWYVRIKTNKERGGIVWIVASDNAMRSRSVRWERRQRNPAESNTCKRVVKDVPSVGIGYKDVTRTVVNVMSVPVNVSRLLLGL